MSPVLMSAYRSSSTCEMLEPGSYGEGAYSFTIAIGRMERRLASVAFAPLKNRSLLFMSRSRSSVAWSRRRLVWLEHATEDKHKRIVKRLAGGAVEAVDDAETMTELVHQHV